MFEVKLPDLNVINWTFPTHRGESQIRNLINIWTMPVNNK